MHRLVSKEIEQYCEAHSTKENELLYDLHRQTYLKTDLPIMLSGHLQGNFFQFLSLMIKPKKILEIGTFTGYATLCLEKGLAENGKIISLELEQTLENFHKDYLSSKKNIEVVYGNAIESLSKLNECFDLIFLDADKTNYENYFDMVFEKWNKGGFMIVDNVLYNSEILDVTKASKNGKAIDKFNKKIEQDTRVENVLLPFRDGIMLIYKK